MLSRSRLLAVMMVAIVLAACGRVALYTGLSEQQSNEVTAALISAGVDAQKTRANDKKGWTVNVSQSAIPRAMNVLKAAGLPSSEYASLGEVFEKKGFVSSPLEEKARYLHGLSQELAHTLTELEGVVVARVHIALPEQDVLSDQLRPSSASVVLVVREHSSIIDREIDIKAIVKDSIEGLEDVNKVTVKFFPSPVAIDPGQSLSAGDNGMLMAGVLPANGLSLVVLILLLAVAGWGAAGWLLWERGKPARKPRIGARPQRQAPESKADSEQDSVSGDEQHA